MLTRPRALQPEPGFQPQTQHLEVSTQVGTDSLYTNTNSSYMNSLYKSKTIYEGKEKSSDFFPLFFLFQFLFADSFFFYFTFLVKMFKVYIGSRVF